MTGLNALILQVRKQVQFSPGAWNQDFTAGLFLIFCTNSLGHWLDSGHPKHNTAEPRDKKRNSGPLFQWVVRGPLHLIPVSILQIPWALPSGQRTYRVSSLGDIVKHQ